MQQRDQIARVLASPPFQSSRQAREFLQYVSERVFEGSTDIEQADIARSVLGRTDFDPTTDASVRKLATSVRQRLEKYYEGAGAADEVLISLPLRSYAPHFETRVSRPVPPPLPVAQPPRRISPWALAAVLTAIAVMAAAVVWTPRQVAGETPEVIRIVTAIGDIMNPGPDAAPGAVRLGNALGTADEIAAEVSFRPEHEGQTAGILIYEGANRYVALSRRFTSRNFLTFASQYDHPLSPAAGNEIADTEGQSGRPVWLRIIRRDRQFTGWYSRDGSAWTQLGPPITIALSATARAGVFAVNGRRPSPPAQAEFRLAGKGPALPPLDGTAGIWRHESSCPGGGSMLAAPPESATWPQCQTSYVRDFSPTGPSGWSVSTRMDAPSSPALSNGIFVSGTAGRLRLVRYHGESPSISLVFDGKFLQPSPDFPGSPPVYLRLRSEADNIVGEFSVDAQVWRRVSTPVPVARLGRLTSFGVVASRRQSASSPVPPIRFFNAQQDLFPAEAIRFAVKK